MPRARLIPVLCAFLLACERVPQTSRPDARVGPPSGPVFLSVDAAAKLEGRPNAAFGLRVPRERWEQWIKDIPEYDGPVPRDCATMVVFPLPTGDSVADGIRFTPWPDEVAVVPQCFNDDPNIACIPIYEFDPRTGMRFARCQCHRIGVEENGDAPRIPPLEFRCRTLVTDAGIRCLGTCPDTTRTCRLVRVRQVFAAAQILPAYTLLGCGCLRRVGT